jgi:hypothetical protein
MDWKSGRQAFIMLLVINPTSLLKALELHQQEGTAKIIVMFEINLA